MVQSLIKGLHMQLRASLELLRRVRLVSVTKDNPVTMPYSIYLGLLSSAIEEILDEQWYLARYPDVQAAIERGEFNNASHHFAVSGLAEGRIPCPIMIDEGHYLTRHRDVARAVESGSVVSATEHFYGTGLFEGRAYVLKEGAE